MGGFFRLLGVCVLAGFYAQASEIAGELASAQRAELAKGRQVVVSRDVAGQPWPELTVYARVAVRPEALAAVFINYRGATAYIPNLKKAVVADQRSACEADVDYTLDIPVLPDEEYTARNTLAELPCGGYSVRWKLLRARHTKASVGEFRVEPDGDGALVRYRSLTTPSSAIAGLLRGMAVSQISATVSALCAEAMRLDRDQPAQLADLVARLESALGR